MKTSLNPDQTDYQALWGKLAASMRNLGSHVVAFIQSLENAGHPVDRCFTMLAGWTPGKVNNTLVVSVHGGVNSGKSTFFNMLCGEQVSPVAAAPKTRHPLAALPSNLDPPDLGLDDLLPGNHRIIMTGDPAAACDPQGEEAVYVVNHDSALPGCLLIDCPDYDSVELNNRRRAREIARASDIILIILTGQSSFAEPTAIFLADVFSAKKVIIPVAGFEMGGSQPAALINNFRSSLQQYRKLDWNPEFAMHMGNLDDQQINHPNPALIGEVEGFQKLDLSKANDRARVKFTVWKQTCQSATLELRRQIGQIEQTGSQWLTAEAAVETEINHTAERLLDDLFPLAELMKIVEDELLGQFHPVTRQLYKFNPARLMAGILKETWGLTRQQSRDLIKKKQACKRELRFGNPTEPGSGPARPVSSELANQAKQEIMAKASEKIRQAMTRIVQILEPIDGVTAPPFRTNQNIEPIIAQIEQFLREQMAAGFFTEQYRQQIRSRTVDWWKEAKRRKWFIQPVLWLLPVAITISTAIAVSIPGIGAAEAALAAIFGPQLLIFLKNNLGIISPLKTAWIEYEKGQLADRLREGFCGDFFQRAANWHDIDEQIPKLRDLADASLTMLAELEHDDN